MSNQIFTDFEDLVKQTFVKLGLNVDQRGFGRSDTKFDLKVNFNGVDIYCDVKFYRSKSVDSSTIKAAAVRLAHNLRDNSYISGALVVSAYVPKKIRNEIYDQTSIKIFDRGILYHLMKLDGIPSEYIERFAKLLIAARQGLDTEDVFENVEGESIDVESAFSFPKTIDRKDSFLEERGSLLASKLNEVQLGKEGWVDFENTSIEILRYLFGGDLSLWKKQPKSEDELNRYDLICKITSKEDFWTALVQSFHTRYVLFEFKNYSEPPTPSIIYSTERYLFTKALRSVCFIISRKRPIDNTFKAANGALRKQGKVIILLDENDLITMLTSKDKGDSPSDILSAKLDEMLVSISR